MSTRFPAQRKAGPPEGGPARQRRVPPPRAAWGVCATAGLAAGWSVSAHGHRFALLVAVAAVLLVDEVVDVDERRVVEHLAQAVAVELVLPAGDHEGADTVADDVRDRTGFGHE